MPQLGGRELADCLKPLMPRPKVSLTSGFPGQVLIPGGDQRPGVSFLSKPYAPVVLAKKSREMLDSPSPEAQRFCAGPSPLPGFTSKLKARMKRSPAGTLRGPPSDRVNAPMCVSPPRPLASLGLTCSRALLRQDPKGDEGGQFAPGYHSPSHADRVERAGTRPPGGPG